MFNSRDLKELKPELQNLALALLVQCRAKDIDVFVLRTFSDNEYQDFLYSQGRTRQGRIVTNARGGESEHNKRNAFDVGIKVNGAPCWDCIDLFKQVGAIGKSLGLVWGGDFKMRDYGHFQGAVK